MLNIRRSTFETNSSSSHSITIPFPVVLNSSELEVNDEGYIEISFCEFCWQEHSTQMDRLAWLVQVIVNDKVERNAFWYHGNDTRWHELESMLYETDDFQRLSAEIAEYVGCKGIRLAEYTSGYIDHESDYPTVDDFLDSYDVTATQFVFGNDIEMKFYFNG